MGGRGSGRGRAPRRPLFHEVGTGRGYRWHLKTGTLPCKACCRGWAVEQRERRLVGRCAKGLGWPL